MTKILLILSFLGLGVLAIGTAYRPNNPLFWLASGATAFQYLRGLLVFILAVQLTTRPPRNLMFRLIAGIVAITVGAWAVTATLNNNMMLLDTLVFMAASFIITASALERTQFTVVLHPKTLG